MMRRPLIDDPNSGEMPGRQDEFIRKLGSADYIPFEIPVKKTLWDIEYDELLERQRADFTVAAKT